MRGAPPRRRAPRPAVPRCPARGGRGTGGGEYPGIPGLRAAAWIAVTARPRPWRDSARKAGRSAAVPRLPVFAAHSLTWSVVSTAIRYLPGSGAARIDSVSQHDVVEQAPPTRSALAHAARRLAGRLRDPPSLATTRQAWTSRTSGEAPGPLVTPRR